jgi:ribosomal-protein-alanine N-acetyltransferase
VTIETPRLQLIPFAAEQILALLAGTDQFMVAFGTPAAPGLREFYGSADVSPAWLEQLRSSSGADPWRHGFAVVHRDDRLVIGCVGFKGPPDGDGLVEIAYGIVPLYQGRGLATEGAAAGVRFAFEDQAVRVVRAHTLPTPNASTRVLTKCGFTRLGEVVDPDDGPVWRWELSRPATAD